MNGAVDVGIITALEIEREAVRQRLEGCIPRHFDDDPHTYYEGHLKVAAAGETYHIVLVMQLGMGNVEAATAAQRLIEHWHPAYVAMVGIAGGVRGKVTVGDVVVGEYCHYYEPGKKKRPGEQRRVEQYRPNRVLFGRARAYDAADWRKDLRVIRPALDAPDSAPVVRFGPIAAGEKVVADDRFLKRLLKECPQLLAIAMEGAGIAKAAADRSTEWIEIRGVSDYADETKKDDGWRVYAADAAAAFLIGLLRTGTIPRAGALARPTETPRPLLVLCAQSLRTIGPHEIEGALTAEQLRQPWEVVSLDLTDLVADRVVTDPAEAARRLADPAGALMVALSRRAQVDLAFQGLCHIPFAMLAGHLVSDRQPVELYDFHPTDSNTWKWPEDAGAAFPELQATGIESLSASTSEVIVTVSISYAVNREAALRVSATGTPVIDMTVPSPERGIVRSAAQVLAYGRILRSTLDGIATRSRSCRAIHVCYAGPMALAFHAGQQVSENIHPPVVAWNYRQPEGFEWGINLSDARCRRPCVVRPPT